MTDFVIETRNGQWEKDDPERLLALAADFEEKDEPYAVKRK